MDAQDPVNLVNLEPVVQLVVLGAVLALVPLAWVWLRHRRADGAQRLRALTVLTLFLTFDLVLFGAFTRLTDSGLGCPDWPGCYGSASPIGARAEIHAAETALPSGPVTHGKAWVEMIHRYLATAVGALILVIAVWSIRQARADRRDGHPSRASPGWALATLAWVCVQGAFGAWTVTLKLYPAIVTAHLLGGLALLALLTVQAFGAERATVAVSPALRRGLFVIAVLTLAQLALGGWVSTNYAVLACRDVPTCQGQWWPPMDFEQGFAILRPLGVGADGGWLPFEALTAIHMVHRIGAVILVTALGVAAWRMAHVSALRRLAAGLGLAAAWQVASGLSNVVLGWPLLAAVAHTAGAAAMVVLVSLAILRTNAVTRPTRARAPRRTAISVHGAP